MSCQSASVMKDLGNGKAKTVIILDAKLIFDMKTVSFSREIVRILHRQ